MSPASLPQVLRRARAQLEELIGRPAEGVVSATRDEDGWQLIMEVTELARVPDSTSIVGSYEVRVDRDGELLEYSRTGRYARNQSGEDEQ